MKGPFRFPANHIVAISAAVMTQACSDPQRAVTPAEERTSALAPSHTLSSGTSSTLLGRSIIDEGFKVKRKTGSWEIDVFAKDPTDVVVATITIQPGGDMGWHSHPGPGFVQVTSGTASFYEADDPSCTPTVVGAGRTWLDRGEPTHTVRNETGVPLNLVVTLLIPPGSIPRIDEPDPGICSF